MRHPTPSTSTFALLLAVVALSGCAAPAPVTSAPVAVTPPPTSASTPPASLPTESAEPSSTAQPQTRSAAAAAFETWVKQFNAEQWDEHHATLVGAQRKLISAKQYAACRNKKTTPTFKWIRTASTKPNVITRIPGTSVKAPATVVVARLRVSNAVTMPVTAHIFYEDGTWHWSMTKENLAGCKK